jgi:hypothetical protein
MASAGSCGAVGGPDEVRGAEADASMSSARSSSSRRRGVEGGVIGPAAVDEYERIARTDGWLDVELDAT